MTLNEYARENDPFAKVGRETIAVEVTSVVRASDSSFQVRWLERIFEGGALKDTKRLTGLFSIVITPPRTVEAVRKNPLGIYVHAFNWSQDVTTAGEPNEPLPRTRAGCLAMALAVARLRDAGAVPEIPILDSPPSRRPSASRTRSRPSRSSRCRSRCRCRDS